MSKRMLLCVSVLLALAPLRLPASKAQSIPARSSFIPISTYRDDPFVAPAIVEQMAAGKFRLDSDEKIAQVLQANLDTLGLGPDFGLKLQSVTRVENPSLSPRRRRGPAQTIVRVQLTQGRGAEAQPLDNHGILVFRNNGLLADYQSPLTPDEQSDLSLDVFAQTRALARLDQAEQLRLDQRGVPLSIVRQPNGQLTVEARVLRGEGLNTYLEVFTLDKPQGERREIVIPPVPPNKRLQIANDLLN